MKNEDFRRAGHRFVDWIADYFENVEDYPVVSRLEPGDVKKAIPAAPPVRGEDMEAIFRDFQDLILPGITHWQHPGWFAYFPANNSPASVLGELLTAGIGAQCMSWQTSPAATELEEVVMDWLRQMIGLPAGFSGVIQDTASTSTLCAVLSAREKASGYGVNETGLMPALTAYASEEVHSSADKAIRIAGIGMRNFRRLPADDRFALVPGKLEEALVRDKEAGLVPAFVMATVGTTSSGAIDPLRAVGEICRRHGVWFHVDAAWAGTAALLPEKRWILDGAETADSLVFNPHKWMATNFDCSAYFVRDPAALVRTFEIHPEYLKTGVDAKVKNYRDWGIQLGRRFRALKLWFVVRSYGVEGLQALVREHIRLAGLFRDRVEADRRFELLAPVDLGLVCFRLNDGRDETALNELNRRFLAAVNAGGTIFLTQTTLRGRFTLRFVVGARTTEERHVRAAWDVIAAAAGEALKG
ncbi:MAG TPA: pyridoxal-dependent decarboxylase [Candidatus Aminicenantes bacterium]|nr:pyridoxal-dependent decarboxylase [Candidatus Aminicenantes bacterium]HRY64257.1 pyridoxal-dependent decarboxylase [Candidatus Aminicenantes bacterium]HRZ71170.1 pyridoxal-dependent decarboxylase [Candidatus Aminicenantes bacterium]